MSEPVLGPNRWLAWEYAWRSGYDSTREQAPAGDAAEGSGAARAMANPGKPSGARCGTRRLLWRKSLGCVAGLVACLVADAQPRAITRRLELSVRPWGFEVKEVRLKAGRWQLEIKNRIGVREFSVQLVRDNGAAAASLLKQEVVDRGRRLTWDHELDLTPGTYILQELSNPRLTCRVIVEP